MNTWNPLAVFIGGILMGTVGVSILKSKEAKKVYTHATAAVLRGTDKIAETSEAIAANIGDIVADANDINDKWEAERKEEEIAKAKAILAKYEKSQASAE